MRLKPQPQESYAALSISLSVEEELVLFGKDVRFDVSCVIREIAYSVSASSLYCYIVDPSSMRYTTPLVTLLRAVVDESNMRIQSGSLSISRFGPQDYGQAFNMVAACKVLTQVIQSYGSAQPSSSSSSSLSISGTESDRIAPEVLCIATVSRTVVIFKWTRAFPGNPAHFIGISRMCFCWRPWIPPPTTKPPLKVGTS